ncbi:MAG: hypothetical protein U0794_22730 [Isosphaeraceae bacterium]
MKSKHPIGRSTKNFSRGSEARRRKRQGHPVLEALERRVLLADGDPDWIRQFSGLNTSGTPSYFDSARAVAISGDAIYVGGRAGGQLDNLPAAQNDEGYIRRFDRAGNSVWTRAIDTSDVETVYGVAADASGVYVVGDTGGKLPDVPSRPNAFGTNAFLRKYNTDGTIAWTRQFGSATTNHQTRALGVAIDATGVYVTGYTEGTLVSGQPSAGLTDGYIRKYDSSGNVLWSRQYGTSGSDGFQTIAVGAGGVYVGGFTDSNGYNGFWRRYDAAGNFLAHVAVQTPSDDSVTGIAVDDSGVYVGGMTRGTFIGNQPNAGDTTPSSPSTDLDGSVVQWRHQFGGTSDDVVSSLVIGQSDVFVVGYTFGALPGQLSLGSSDTFLRKLNSLGNQEWTRLGTARADYAYGAALDSGSLVVVGETAGTFAREPDECRPRRLRGSLHGARIPVVQFAVASQSAPESAGIIHVTLTLDVASTRDVLIPYDRWHCRGGRLLPVPSGRHHHRVRRDVLLVADHPHQ